MSNDHIQGQDVSVRVSQDGKLITSLKAITSFEFGPQTEAVLYQFLGSRTPKPEMTYNGVEFSLEILHRDPYADTLFVESFTFIEIPNLVPEAPGKSPNYWCTWYAQNYWIGRGEEITDLKRLSNANAREELNEQTVFGSREGWAVNMLPGSRCDYYFLIDHGWQVKDKGKRLQGLPFFSFQLDI